MARQAEAGKGRGPTTASGAQAARSELSLVTRTGGGGAKPRGKVGAARGKKPSDRPTATKAGPAKRGRPPGSPSLTAQTEDAIVGYVQAGATRPAAARAEGIAPRTLREWIERGEDRHPSRKTSRKYRRLAIRIRRAEGEARVVAENRLYTQNARAWLKGTARATPEDEGWSDAPGRPGAAPSQALQLGALSEDELTSALDRMLQVAGERVAAANAVRASPRRSARRKR